MSEDSIGPRHTKPMRMAPDKWGRGDSRIVKADHTGIRDKRTGELIVGKIEPPSGEGVFRLSEDEANMSEVMMKPKTEKPKVDTKDPYNPKDAVGVRKWRQFTTIPWTVLLELGVAMLEGARKYGRHNYRAAPVRASVYLDAAVAGHIIPWWEGENLDPDTNLSHITKAIASLTVLRDAMIQGTWIDDRPPHTDMGAFRTEMQARVDEIFERIPEAKAAFLEGDQYDRS